MYDQWNYGSTYAVLLRYQLDYQKMACRLRSTPLPGLFCFCRLTVEHEAGKRRLGDLRLQLVVRPPRLVHGCILRLLGLLGRRWLRAGDHRGERGHHSRHLPRLPAALPRRRRGLHHGLRRPRHQLLLLLPAASSVVVDVGGGSGERPPPLVLLLPGVRHRGVAHERTIPYTHTTYWNTPARPAPTTKMDDGSVGRCL